MNEELVKRIELVAASEEIYGFDDIAALFRQAAKALQDMQETIGQFNADFADCNSEQSRWKSRAEAAEKRCQELEEVIRRDTNLHGFIAGWKAMADPIRAEVLKLPRRLEPISGQKFNYVKLQDVIDVIDGELHYSTPSSRADAIRECIAVVESMPFGPAGESMFCANALRALLEEHR